MAQDFTFEISSKINNLNNAIGALGGNGSDIDKIIQYFKKFTEPAKIIDGLTKNMVELQSTIKSTNGKFSDLQSMNDFIGKISNVESRLQSLNNMMTGMSKNWTKNRATLMPISEVNKYLDTKEMMKGIDPAKLQTLKESIMREGFGNPVSISYNKNTNKAQVTDNSHMILAAQELGFTDIPVNMKHSDSNKLRYDASLVDNPSFGRDKDKNMDISKVLKFDSVGGISDTTSKIASELDSLYEAIKASATKMEGLKEIYSSSPYKKFTDVGTKPKDEPEKVSPTKEAEKKSAKDMTKEEYMANGMQRTLGTFEEFHARLQKKAEDAAKKETESKKAETKTVSEDTKKAISQAAKDAFTPQLTDEELNAQLASLGLDTPKKSKKVETPELTDTEKEQKRILEQAKADADRRAKLEDEKIKKEQANSDKVTKQEEEKIKKETVDKSKNTKSESDNIEKDKATRTRKSANEETPKSTQGNVNSSELKSFMAEFKSLLTSLKGSGNSDKNGPITINGGPVKVTGGPVTVTGTPVSLTKAPTMGEKEISAPQLKNANIIDSDKLTSGNSSIKTFIQSIKELRTEIAGLEKQKGVIYSIFSEFGRGKVFSTGNSAIKDLASGLERIKKLGGIISAIYSEFQQSKMALTNSQQLNNTIRDTAMLLEAMYKSIGKLGNAESTFTKLQSNVTKLNDVVATLDKTMSQADFQNIKKIMPYLAVLQDTLYVVEAQMKDLSKIQIDTSNVQKLIKMLSSLTERNQNLVNSMNGVNNSKMIAYFNQLIGVLAQMDSKIKKISPDFAESVSNMSGSIKSLQSLLSSTNKLIDRLGTAGDTSKLDEYFKELIVIVKNLFRELSALGPQVAVANEVTASLKNLSEAFKNASQTQQQFNNHSNNVNNSPIRETGRIINDNSAAMGRFARIFSNEGKGILSFFQDMQYKLTNFRYTFEALAVFFGARTMYNWLIGVNAQIEVLQKSLEVTMKSAEKAESTIRTLRDYAALTPFMELETFQAGEMFAANRMDVEKWITVAGDLASAKKSAGVQLEDVVNVFTRVNSGDFGKAMIRLRQMGISLNDLRAEGMKFSKNNTFLGTTDEMLGALETIINRRYGGLTQVLGQTVEGSISTIKDYIQQLGIDIGENLFGKFRGAVNDIKDQLGDFRNSVDFKEMINDFNHFIDQIKVPVTTFFNVIAGLAKVLVSNIGLIGAGLRVMIDVKLFQVGLNFFVTMANNTRMVNQAIREQNALYTEQGVILSRGDLIRQRISNGVTRFLSMSRLGGRLQTNQDDVNRVVTEQSLTNASPGAINQQRDLLQAREVQLQTELAGARALATAAENEAVLAAERHTQARTRLTAAQQANAQSATVDTEAELRLAEADMLSAQASLDATAAQRAQSLATIRNSETALAATSSQLAIVGASATQTATVFGGALATMGGAIMTFMEFLPWLMLIGMAVGAVKDALTKKNSEVRDPLSSVDYTRIIGQQEEELSLLERLNQTRKDSKDVIDSSGKKLSELDKEIENANKLSKGTIADTDKLTELQRRRSVVQDNLNKAEQQRVSAVRQIIDVEGNLSTVLVDSNGKISDESASFSENTKEIEKNINARKLLISANQLKKEVSSEMEMKDSQETIKSNDEKIAILNGKHGVFEKGGSWFLKNVSDNLGILRDAADFVTGGQVKRSIEKAKLVMMGKDDKQNTINALNVGNLDERQKIQNSKNVLDENLEAIRAGYLLRKGKSAQTYVKGKNGEYQYDKDGVLKTQTISEDVLNSYIKNNDSRLKDVVSDISSYHSYLSKQSKQQLVDVNNTEGIVSNIQEIVSSGDSQSQNAGRFAELQAQLALNKANGDTTDADYLKWIDKKNKAISDSLQDNVDELKTMSGKIVKSRNDAVKDIVDPNFFKLIDGGVSVDEITNQIDRLKQGLDSTLDPKFLTTIQAFFDTVTLKGGNISDVIKDAQLNQVSNAEEMLKTITNAINERMLKIAQSNSGGSKANKKDPVQLINDLWDKRKDIAQLNKDQKLLDNQLNGILDGTKAWRSDVVENDKLVRGIISSQITALQRALDHQKLTKVQTEEARLKILQLQKEASTLDLEIKNIKTNDSMEFINQQYDPKISYLESQRDKALAQQKYNDVLQGSALDYQTRKSFGSQELVLLRAKLNDVLKLSRSADPQKQLEAMSTANQLQVKIYEVLGEIKKNTDSLGEFNKPGNVKVMTYYDYVARENGYKGIHIGSADFSINVEKLQTEQDLKNLEKLLGDYINRVHNSGTKNVALIGGK